jgi:hypothetical protein
MSEDLRFVQLTPRHGLLSRSGNRHHPVSAWPSSDPARRRRHRDCRREPATAVAAATLCDPQPELAE